MAAAASNSDMRREDRAKTLLSATAVISNRTEKTTIRNISSAGALLHSSQTPPVGTTLLLRRGEAAAAAEVVWNSSDTYGIRFTHKIDLELWVPDLDEKSCASKAKEEVEDITVDQLLARFSEELACIARASNNINLVLVSDPVLRMRHAFELQQLALAEEMLRQIAASLSDRAPVEAARRELTGPLRSRVLRRAPR